MDITVVIVPGICNSSESDYIRTFVNYTQNQGYRCAVLNHVGALHNVPVTASRIFTYGKYIYLNIIWFIEYILQENIVKYGFIIYIFIIKSEFWT